MSFQRLDWITLKKIEIRKLGIRLRLYYAFSFKFSKIHAYPFTLNIQSEVQYRKKSHDPYSFVWKPSPGSMIFGSLIILFSDGLVGLI